MLDAILGRFWGESAEQIAVNKLSGQKPDWVSWEEYTNPRFDNPWFDHCHWYDPKHLTPVGHCNGRWRHDHQPRYMKAYWRSPLSLIIPPLYFLWEGRAFVLSAILERLGWYWVLEKFGVDTSPQ